MEITVNMKGPDKIQIMPGSTKEEIIQNVGIILSTPLEGVPMARNVGMSRESSSKPDTVGVALLTRDCHVAVKEQEQRVSISTVDFDGAGDPGGWEAKMEVSFTDG